MTAQSRRASDVLEIALVNNMPDQALAATQAQFARLVRAAAGGRKTILRCYWLPGLTRSEVARRNLARNHEDIEALYRRGADAMIVTGSEPRASRLEQEPFWPQMRMLVDWARLYTLSTLWSCLAAHAAAKHLTGIERRRSPKKISGVYLFRSTGPDWRRGETPSEVRTPHSRYNDLPRDALEQAGFNIASFSEEVGVDMFWREEPSLFVFLQGHPEYDADTLMKEYRRDAQRYFAGDGSDYPDQPENYFSEEIKERLDALRHRRCVDALGMGKALNDILSAESPEDSWSGDSASLFANWLDAVSDRAEKFRVSA